MDANAMFPSNYLKAAEIGDHRPVVTIEKIEIETLGQGEEQEKKPVIYFKAKEKGLVSNKTNWNTLIELFGPETEDWIGQRIMLITAPATYKGKSTMALRVMPAPAPTAGKKAMSKQIEAPEEPLADQEIPF